jgi:uncharacterized coiled-coil protein SlyX
MFSTEQDSPPDMLLGPKEDGIAVRGELQGDSEEALALASADEGGGVHGFEVEMEEGGVEKQEEGSAPERMTLREIMKSLHVKARNPTPAAILRQKWRHAIQSVILQNRRKRLKLSLGKSRVNKNMSLMDRLERIEEQIFEIPNNLLTAMEEGLVSAASAMEKKVARVERLIEKNQKEHEKTISCISEAVAGLEEDIKEVNSCVSKLSGLVEARVVSELEALNRVRDVGDRVQSLELSHISVVKKKVAAASEQLKLLEKSFQEVNNQVYEMIAKSSIAVDSKDEEVIVLLLEIDSKLKKNREAVMNVEGNARFLQRLIEGVREELNEMAKVDANLRIEELKSTCDDTEKSVETVIKGIGSIHNYFDRHDNTLAERWLGFSKVIAAAKSTATISSKLKSLQSVVEEKPSRKTVLELIRESTEQFGAAEEKTGALEATVNVQAKELEQLRIQLQELSESVAKQREETERLRLKEAEKLVAPEPVAPKVDPAELNNILNPMIKTIVDTYLASANLAYPPSTGRASAKSKKNQEVWFDDAGFEDINKTENWLKGDDPEFSDALPEAENESKFHQVADLSMNDVDAMVGQDELTSFNFVSSDNLVFPQTIDASPVASHPPSRQGATTVPDGANRNFQTQNNFAKALRNQLKHVTDQLEDIYKQKLDAETFDKAMRFKADAVALVEKADQSVVDTIENTVKRFAAEIGDLRMVQTESVAGLRDELTRQLDDVLRRMLLMHAENDNGIGLVSTKTLCLACGQACRVRAHARPAPKSPRSEAVDPAARLDPADMIPSHSATPLHTLLSIDPTTSVVPLSPNRAIIRGRLDALGESALPRMPQKSQTPNIKSSDRRKLEQLASKIGDLQSDAVIDTDSLDASIDLVRPMHRKGFPGKKSAKALVSNLHKCLHAYAWHVFLCMHPRLQLVLDILIHVYVICR